MEIEWQNISAKCPNKDCKSIFKFKQGGFPYFNDEGGWKLKCNNCEQEFIIHVINPFDLSYVDEGVEIVEMREGTLEETRNWSLSESLLIEPIESLIYVPEILEPINYILDEYPLYFNNRNENLEEKAYEELKKQYVKIKENNYNYYQGYVKGRFGDPKFGYIFLDFENNEDKHTAVFYYKFTSRSTSDFPKKITEILLAHITNSVDLSDLINGIYTRNNCLSYLNKLLIRWRGLFQFTVMVVPFVGYQNQKAKTRIDLWKDIKVFLNEPNCFLLTRHIAKSLLEKSEEHLGIPANLIKEFQVEDEAFKNMSLFNLFHAKFFGGINDDFSEVLKGSFNIQKNAYLENIDLSVMNSQFFQERFLNPLKVNLEDKEDSKDAIVIDLRNDKNRLEIEFQYGSGMNLITKYNL